MLLTIQSILMPVSFGFLFFLMLLYWGQIALFSYTKYKTLSFLVFCISFFLLTSLLGLRWVESRHFPLSNLYESLLFLSWSFLLSQFVLQLNLRDNTKQNITTNSVPKKQMEKSLHSQSAPPQKESLLQKRSHERGLNPPSKDTLLENPFSVNDLLGVVLSPLALVSYGFAFLNLPKDMQKATSLVPALQSNWLMMHVTVMILSYAALLCGSILSMAFLLVSFLSQLSGEFESNQIPLAEANQNNSSNERLCNHNPFTENKVDTVLHTTQQMVSNQRFSPIFLNSQLSLCDLLDNLSYRILGLGFPLLTVGILSGAVWANSAWGSYWSWDPKETWALITWLVFAIYLHARITKGWSGQKPAIIATAGFFVVWFCYLGVNLIGTGLHSYGWFQINS